MLGRFKSLLLNITQLEKNIIKVPKEIKITNTLNILLQSDNIYLKGIGTIFKNNKKTILLYNGESVLLSNSPLLLKVLGEGKFLIVNCYGVIDFYSTTKVVVNFNNNLSPFTKQLRYI